jgi:hypothetical protein
MKTFISKHPVWTVVLSIVGIIWIGAILVPSTPISTPPPPVPAEELSQPVNNVIPTTPKDEDDRFRSPPPLPSNFERLRRIASSGEYTDLTPKSPNFKGVERGAYAWEKDVFLNSGEVLTYRVVCYSSSAGTPWVGCSVRVYDYMSYKNKARSTARYSMRLEYDAMTYQYKVSPEKFKFAEIVTDERIEDGLPTIVWLNEV